jgi:hypothetical protein
MKQSRSWEADRLFSYSRNSPHIIESEGSLPWSQEPTTGPYGRQTQYSASKNLAEKLIC